MQPNWKNSMLILLAFYKPSKSKKHVLLNVEMEANELLKL